MTPVLYLFKFFAEVDNDCHSLHSILDEGRHEGSMFGSMESNSDNFIVDWFLLNHLKMWNL